MPDPARKPLANRLAGALKAAFRVCRGQSPDEPPAPPPPAHHLLKHIAEKLGPYPTQD